MAVAASVAGHLTKPYHTNELLTLIDSLTVCKKAQ